MADHRHPCTIDPADTRHPDVLVVTHDDELRDRTLDAISPAAGAIAVTHHARHAVGRMHEGGFDAVMVDLEVPQGWALLRFLGAIDHSVMALVPSLDDEALGTARALGASAALPRSFSVPALLRVGLLRAIRQRGPKPRTLAAV